MTALDFFHLKIYIRPQNSIPEVHENPTFQDEDSFESDSNDSVAMILNRAVAPPPPLDRGRHRPVPIPRLTNNRPSKSPSGGNVYTLEPTDFRNLNGEYFPSTSGPFPVTIKKSRDSYKIFISVNGNSDTISTKEYYDESIGRDAASRILSQHGSKHSFLIRARNAAGDVLTAPYVMDFFIFRTSLESDF